MKKIIFILQAVTFFLLCSCDSQGFTAMTFDNNIRSEIKIENLNGKEGVAIYYSSLPFWLRVPDKIYDYDVIRISLKEMKTQADLVLLTLPNTVQVIDNLNGCTSLKTITYTDSLQPQKGIMNGFPESLLVFPEMIGCTSLESVKIPDNVSFIRQYTFYSCSALTNANTGKNVTSIKQNAFEDCTKLETVTLEAKTTNIEPNAFLNCTSLTTVICLASEPPALDITSFSKKGESESDRYAKKITVSVPFESVEEYKNHEIWGTFKEIKGI